MPAYKHVLVALDLTPESDRLIEHARAFSALFQARISLLHVVEQARVDGPYVNLDFSAIEQQLKREAEQRLAELAARNNIPERNCSVELGVASQLIHDCAEQSGADLILVGSHGRHGISLLLGSTANAVLHGARCDVLAVRIKKSSQKPE